MVLQLEITNADENLLKALKGVVRLYPQSKLKVKRQNSKGQKLTVNGFTEEFEMELLRELEETRRDYAAGKIKAYSADEFRKAVDNGEI
ncbi:hypothetical protein LS71_001200 [Helicobacter jaachi]|uniref:Uncharacterized protein n=1 Tax=Helicobacter jaachi TaxID=1677920 RepID=A0A4U8TF96_9HELI|nr:hypothetical protein [Helicobacter jaachi]TLD97397.1 hypothetical protein LS71_001200 [Helicobacter jaachi]